MAKEYKIEVGDIVKVFTGGNDRVVMERAMVLYIPCATGDSWRFKEMHAGNIVYISEGISVWLIEKNDGDIPF